MERTRRRCNRCTVVGEAAFFRQFMNQQVEAKDATNPNRVARDGVLGPIERMVSRFCCHVQLTQQGLVRRTLILSGASHDSGVDQPNRGHWVTRRKSGKIEKGSLFIQSRSSTDRPFSGMVLAIE